MPLRKGISISVHVFMAASAFSMASLHFFRACAAAIFSSFGLSTFCAASRDALALAARSFRPLSWSFTTATAPNFCWAILSCMATFWMTGLTASSAAFTSSSDVSSSLTALMPTAFSTSASISANLPTNSPMAFLAVTWAVNSFLKFLYVLIAFWASVSCCWREVYSLSATFCTSGAYFLALCICVFSFVRTSVILAWDSFAAASISSSFSVRASPSSGSSSTMVVAMFVVTSSPALTALTASWTAGRCSS
mmetsp:Transcript_42262/g.110035  ORF Transcript_42262/g.110035 Transcript_42262/m.110035 type:complete len:251 (+) Transcript_42262:631-1383(+)